MASSLRRNSTTTSSQSNRKKRGHRTGFSKTSDYEPDYGVAGKKDEAEARRKETIEGRLKCPKMVHDMMCSLVQRHRSIPGDLVTVGFIMMGM